METRKVALSSGIIFLVSAFALSYLYIGNTYERKISQTDLDINSLQIRKRDLQREANDIVVLRDKLLTALELENEMKTATNTTVTTIETVIEEQAVTLQPATSTTVETVSRLSRPTLSPVTSLASQPAQTPAAVPPAPVQTLPVKPAPRPVTAAS